MTNIKKPIDHSKRWFLSGTPLSHQEFTAGIKKAEKGPFHSIQKSMENFELWLTSREKK